MCQIDQGKLSNGLFRILALEGVLPDGTIVFFPQHDLEALEIDLTPYATQIHKNPLKVYLCLPNHTFSQTQNEAQTRLKRYDSIETLPVSDHNSGENAVPLARLRPTFQLMVGTVAPERYVAIPLAELIVHNNAFTQTTFLPPLLRVNLEEPLGQACLNLVHRLREKIAQLQGKLQHVTPATEHSASTQETVQTRKSLMAGLLPLEASLYAKGGVHPYELFKSLVNLASHGATLPHILNAPVLPSYDHENLQSVFQELFAFADTMLDGVEQAYLAMPFTQQDRVYSLYLKEGWASQTLTLGITAPTELSEEALKKWIENCVIATDSIVRTTQDNRMLGAKRECIQEIPELHLTATRGTILCNVHWDPHFIKEQEALHLFNISDTPQTRPQQINLYLPNPKVKV